MSKAILRTG